MLQQFLARRPKQVGITSHVPNIVRETAIDSPPQRGRSSTQTNPSCSVVGHVYEFLVTHGRSTPALSHTVMLDICSASSSTCPLRVSPHRGDHHQQQEDINETAVFLTCDHDQPEQAARQLRQQQQSRPPAVLTAFEPVVASYTARSFCAGIMASWSVDAEKC